MKRARVIYNPTSGKETLKRNLADILECLEQAGYEASAYATTPENYGSTITSANNWLNMSQNYWTNSRVNTTNNRFFYINTSGNLAISDVSNTYVIRPSFYLNSTVMLSSGDGTINSPYRIEV